MINSIRNLLNFPYNKKHPILALLRLIEWKTIRFFKVKNYKKRVWHNRILYLNFDSLQSMWVMHNWIVDWEEFNLIKNLVIQDDICIDVGANMGFYSIWFSKFTNNKIYSFEPNQKNYNRLLKNIEVNKNLNIVAYNCGLSDKSGKAVFTYDRDGENHIVVGETSLKTETINLSTLDQLASENKIDKIKYLKIDVEGFELKVVQGATQCLKNKKIDLIQLEINSSLINSGSSVQDLNNFLDSFDYFLVAYDTKLNQLKKISYNNHRENYFAVHDIDSLNNVLKCERK